jgi:hypothetical protein
MSTAMLRILAPALATALAAHASLAIPPGDWDDPPRGTRPVARWWWPGGSVEATVIERELARIERAGFGAVELQPLLLGIGAGDLAADPRLRSVGEPDFLAAVAHAVAAAARVGLDFDLTLGSGWPGGLPTPKANAERQLLMATADVAGGRFAGPLPPAPDVSYRRSVEWVLDVLGPPDSQPSLVAVLAGRIGPERDGVPVLEEVRVLDDAVEAGRLDWIAPEGRWRIFAFYEGSTEHFVMGGAFPGREEDARAVDHLSRRGADALLRGYGVPVLDAVSEGRVRELFVDSFELLGELPFTGGFPEAFEARVGYDLVPHLPLVFRKGGESKYAEMMDLFGRGGGPLYAAPDPERAQRIREDYEAVRRGLFEERFVARIAEWARGRGLALRLQAHGGYGNYLDVYALSDVPESEALFAGGRFDFLKLAASAAHVAGRRFASSESFITLRLWGTRLPVEEMRLLTGRAYAAGINRLAFHGVPYPYTRDDGEVWYPFTGGFGRILAGPLPMTSHFDAEALAALPEFNRFLARLTVAMSHGEPSAEVAWLRAEPVFPDEASVQIGRIEARAGESDTTRVLRARGLVHDRVSRRMLAGATAADGVCAIGARRYRAVLLDPIPVAEPELVERIAAIGDTGVPVLALGALPERAPGLRDAAARDARVRAASKRLAALVHAAATPERLEALLARHVENAWVSPPEGERLEVSIERRHDSSGATLLVFNESRESHTARLRFTRAGTELWRWDPRTGEREKLRDRVEAGDELPLALDAAETLLLTLRSPVLATP